MKKRLSFIIIICFFLVGIILWPKITNYKLVKTTTIEGEQIETPKFFENLLISELSPIVGNYHKTHILTFKGQNNSISELYIGIHSETGKFVLEKEDSLYDLSGFFTQLLSNQSFLETYYKYNQVQVSFFVDTSKEEIGLARLYTPKDDSFRTSTTLLSAMKPPTFSAPSHTKFSWKTNTIPKSTYYKIFDQQDRLLEEGFLETNNLIQPKQNGFYRYEIIMLFDKEHWSEEIHMSFNNNVLFKTNLVLNSSKTIPGGIIKASINNISANKNYRIENPFTNKSIPLFYTDDGISMFIPVDCRINPGNYKINLYENKLLIDTQEIIIEERQFDIQNLTINQDVSDNTRTDNAYAELNEAFSFARQNPISSPLWKDSFIKPVDGLLTTQFGEIRYVNGEKSSSRHLGIDLATTLGTNIVASNSGKVVLSEFLTLTGNTIIIEHGAGLYSHYYHLDSLNVSKGDNVNSNTIIGTIGTTGFSTGPHLHFGYYLNGFYVDPFEIINKNFID